MYYFAYASNLNRKQMAERCPNAKPKFVATLPHYKLIFAGWSRQQRGGVASIRPCRDEKVIGAIYEVSEKDLIALDKYETGYKRMNVFVFTEDGDRIQAVTYVKVDQSEETRPSQEYLVPIQQGYKDWRIV